MSDLSLKCKECGKDFIFTEGEQKFYADKKFTNPTRCPECRKAKNNRNFTSNQ